MEGEGLGMDEKESAMVEYAPCLKASQLVVGS